MGNYAMANTADSQKINEALLKTTPQSCENFVKAIKRGDQPIVQYNAKQVMASFLRYYFAPWDQPTASFSAEELKTKQTKNIQKYLQKPGRWLNGRAISQEVIKAIGDNMNLAAFPNCKQKAIVVRKTHLRTIATSTRSFTDGPGQGYPFDRWQESLIHVNEPLYVLHTSQDQVWNFVITNSHICGWVLRADLAYATPEFIAQWRAADQYVTPLRDHTPVTANTAAPLAAVGQVIPLAPKQGDTSSSHQILSVYADQKGLAAIQQNTIHTEAVTTMPLPATPNNMAQLANQLMGQPYGWGGVEGYRDCSALVKDLCLPFGIWMPRDSGPQSKASTTISLENLKPGPKAKQIIKQGTPFFSLLWMPGHIVLYIGHQKKVPYVYNNIWGLKTQSTSGQEGRAIFGRTIVMPADLGQQYSNVPQTLLDKATKLIQLTERLTNPDQKGAL